MVQLVPATPERSYFYGRCGGYSGVPKPIGEDPEMFDLKPLGVGYSMAKCNDAALSSYLAKCQVPIPPLPPEFVALIPQVCKLVWERLPWSRCPPIRGMTHEEALCEMKPNTACGFPFTEASKGEFLTDVNRYRLFHNFGNLVTSPRYTTVAYKVEALPDETVARKGCRILRYVNIDFLYKQLRLYGHMMHLHNEGADWPRDMCCGAFNEFSGGWEKLHSAFDGMDAYGSDGKYYDTCFDDFDYAVIDLLLRRAMGDRDADVHCFIMNNSRDSIGLVRTRELWRFRNTHSTGHLLTKVFNDLKTCAGFALAYLIEYRRQQLDPQREFELFSRCVVTAICGDDNLFASSLEWFTGPLLREINLRKGTTFELEKDYPSRSDELGFLSTRTVVDQTSGWRLPLHRCGKTIARVVHAKHDERTVEMRWQRVYGALLTCWPDPIYRQALQKKLTQMRPYLEENSIHLRDHFDDRHLRFLYTGLEGGC